MRKISLLLFALFAFILTGCEESEALTGGSNQNSKENSFTLLYEVSGLVSATTRTTVSNETGEGKVNSFYLLFFENTTDQSGNFIAAIDAMEAYSSMGSSGKLEITYPGNSGLLQSKSYKILFCANFEQFAELPVAGVEDIEEICNGYTEKEAIGRLRMRINGTDDESDDSEAILSSGLPMFASAVKAAKEEELSIELNRSVVRLDLANEADGYELVSAAIWNANKQTTLWPGTNVGGDGRTERFYGVSATDNRIVGGLYAFENSWEVPVQNDRNTTCLIVGLMNTGSGNTEYFRMNIHADDKGQELKRNNVYRSTIKHVMDTGADSEREAYESATDLLKTDINGWSVDINGNVVYDDNNILALPTSLITLQGVGEIRENLIFTYGPGTLRMTKEGIPSNVVVELFNDQLYIYAPESAVEWTGTLHFSLGNLTNSITLSQGDHFNEFLNLNFDIEDLPAFSHTSGVLSPEIEVNSSGTWVAEIYSSNYISFGSSATQVTRITGNADTSFTLRTIAKNTTSATRYCFVIVSLVDSPEISRALVLQQLAEPEEYIRFNPDIKNLKVVGERTLKLKLESNAEWTAEISRLLIYDEDGIVTFPNGKTSISGNGDDWITLNFPNKVNKNLTMVYITATTKKSRKTVSASFYWWSVNSGEKPDPDPEPTPNPEPAPKKDMLFVSNGTGAGNLVSTTSDGYRWYVYGLGQNMRNSTKFGNGGTLANIGKDAFEYTSTFSSANIADAKIIQLVSTPSTTNFDRIYKNMQADPMAFLMITSTDATVVNNILKMFKEKSGAKYGSATQIANPAINRRPISSAASSHPLMQYLLNGPAGTVNAGYVDLQGSLTTCSGLMSSAYPDTFVPIVMSNTTGYYCVFGIDPVNRLIIMTDPGIFGAAPNLVAYPSYKNFLSSASTNSKFLDNLTAWIINATGKSGFLGGFQ